jgi:Mn2+/Fe2+ NRAMP family transporter
MPKNTLKRKTVGLLVAAMLMLGAMPGVAAAQGPTSDQYDPSTITFQDNSGGGLNDSVGPLPFTGFDVIAMLAVALAVTGLGLALQRAVSREPKDLR